MYVYRDFFSDMDPQSQHDREPRRAYTLAHHDAPSLARKVSLIHADCWHTRLEHQWDTARLGHCFSAWQAERTGLIMIGYLEASQYEKSLQLGPGFDPSLAYSSGMARGQLE